MFSSSSFELFIQLERNSYEGGGQVNGSVYLNVRNTVRAYALSLLFNGQEFARFTSMVPDPTPIPQEERERGTTSRPDIPKVYTKTKMFYSTEQALTSFPSGTINPGQYSFPFSFTLGQGVPSTFQHMWKTGAHQNDAIISYTLTARLVDNNNFRVGQETIKYINVQNAMKDEDPALSTRKIDKNYHITNFCCKSAGEVRFVTYFEKDRYYSDEDVYIVCEINNSKGVLDVSSVRAIFSQVMKISVDNVTEEISRSIKSEKVDLNLPPEKSMTGSNAVRLMIPLKGKTGDFKAESTVNGSIIRCYHNVEVYLTLNTCCGTTPMNKISVSIFQRPEEQQARPSFANNSTMHVNKPFVFTPHVNAGNGAGSPTGGSGGAGNIGTNYPTMEW